MPVQTFVKVNNSVRDRVHIIHVEPWKTLSERLTAHRRKRGWMWEEDGSVIVINAGNGDLTGTLLYIYPNTQYVLVEPDSRKMSLLSKYSAQGNIDLRKGNITGLPFERGQHSRVGYHLPPPIVSTELVPRVTLDDVKSCKLLAITNFGDVVDNIAALARLIREQQPIVILHGVDAECSMTKVVSLMFTLCQYEVLDVFMTTWPEPGVGPLPQSATIIFGHVPTLPR